MKKKLVMKKWMEKLLLVIGLIAVLMGASDCDNTKVFLITHGLAFVILLFIALMFVFYGRDGD